MSHPQLGPFQPVADGVLVAVAEPAGVNVGVVVGDTAALVVDTGSSPAQGAAVRRAAEAAAGVPVAAVVVTHWHWDHWFGLAGFAGIPSYAHESVAGRLADPALPGLADAHGLDAEDVVAPTELFSLARVIDLGGRRVELVHFGRGHTEGDVVAIVPDANLVFAGDLLEQSAPPSFGEDSFLRYWPSALDGILGLIDEDTVIIPGHGTVVDRMFAFDQRARISGLYGQVEHLVRQGIKADGAYEAGDWPFPEEVVRAALPLAYAELAAAGLVPRTQLPLL